MAKQAAKKAAAEPKEPAGDDRRDSIHQDLANHTFGTWAAGKTAAVGGVPYAYIALGVVVLLAGAAYKLRGSELLRNYELMLCWVAVVGEPFYGYRL